MKDIVRRMGWLATTATVIIGACRGPAGPPLNGAWAGFVYLHDEYGAPLASDSGITVSLLPTQTVDTSTTDDVGGYSFSGLNTGVYTLQYVGPGYGTYIASNQQFLGGGTVNIPSLNLSKQSTAVISGFTMTPSTSGDTILATGTITAPPAGVARYVRLFYSLATTVGSNDTLWTVTGPVTGLPYAVTSAAFTIVVTGQDLLALRGAFGSGKPVNVVAYGDSYFEESYQDQARGRLVYPNVAAKASNLATFIMP